MANKGPRMPGDTGPQPWFTKKVKKSNKARKTQKRARRKNRARKTQKRARRKNR